ncbi:AEC family transporter [Lichenihabitans sp. Uapishka_5]|uniref:AEC family transporter n=1 Tax=Lichenihabitans sp. Uapishka_5 TaxID=3037302 RepID=UPI0029E7CD35|nr:AEC family transporter [Lichenihabitans sp. Uapishka_5]MDX7952489.1 AEC family transporter [Lichenihabitans sp. Uapishka_5]
MLATTLVVLPVFALIFAGWLVRRLGVLGPQATGELNRFVVYLALPALLFDITANAKLADLWQPGFIAAFGFGCGATFALTLAWRWRRPRPLADATLDALNAAYANTGFVGFPLALAALGPTALPPTLIATILTVCVLFAVAIVLIEVGLQTEAHPARLAAKVARSLGRNPLLVAPVLGALVPLAGLGVPASAEQFLKLLGGAASPCALVALGLFLAEPRPSQPGTAGGTAGLVGLKLLAQPVLTYGCARVLALPAPLTHAAVLLAALPTGTGPFMLAEFYRREAAVTARVILASTLLSVFTVAAYLALIG